MDQPGFKPKYWGANTTGPSTANGTEPATSAEADEILPVNPFDLEPEEQAEDELELHPQRTDRYKNSGTDELSEYSDEQDVDHGMLPLDPELSLTNYYINVSLTRVLDVESSTYRLEVKITPYLMNIETGNFELSTGSNFLIRSISLMQTGSGGSNQRGYNVWITNPSSETSTIYISESDLHARNSSLNIDSG